MEIYKTLVCMLILASVVSAASSFTTSYQMTNVKNISSGSNVNSATVSVCFLNSTDGTLIHNDSFGAGTPYSVLNGSANMMLGENTSNKLQLLYGEKYYVKQYVEGESFTYTDAEGNLLNNLTYYSPLGDIQGKFLINDTNFTTKVVYAVIDITNALNTSKAANGTCAVGEVVQNATATGVQCIAAGVGSGTVTNVASGAGLTGGPITTTGTLSLDLAYVNTTLMGNSTIARTGAATCGAGTVVQNITTTTSGVTSQCIATGGTGTVTNLGVGYGITSSAGANTTTTGTFSINTVDMQNFNETAYITNDRTNISNIMSNFSNYYNKTSMPYYANGSSNLTLTDIASNLGNWSGNSSLYTPTTGISAYIGNSSIVRNATYSCAENYTTNNITISSSGISAQCIPTGSGTASVTSGDSYIIVNLGVITFNLSAADLRYKNSTWLQSIFPIYNNLSLTDITANIGNWSADKSNYVNASYVEALGNLTNYYNKTTGDGRYAFNNSLTAVNTSLTEATGNISGLNTTLNTAIGNASALTTRFNLANTTLNTTVTTQAANIASLNTTMETYRSSSVGFTNTTGNISTNRNMTFYGPTKFLVPCSDFVCGSAYRGVACFNTSASGISDYVFMCGKDSGDSYGLAMLLRWD